MPRLRVVLVGIAIVAGCASTASIPTVEELRAANSTSVIGRITKRAAIAANPRWAGNEDVTRAVSGEIGVLISQMRGTPQYYEYWVKGIDEPQYSFQSFDEFLVDSCVRIYIRKDKEGKRGWFLDEVAAENVKSCP